MTFHDFYTQEALPMLTEWDLVRDDIDPHVLQLILLRTWNAAQTEARLESTRQEQQMLAEDREWNRRVWSNVKA